MKPITNVDWELLRDQKQVLLQVMADLEEEHRNGCISDEYLRERIDGFSGILNLLDSIQDEVVALGLETEETVFGPREKDDEED